MRGLVAVFALLLLVPPVTADWRSFHNDERNTGFQAGTEYQVYEDVWWSKKLADSTQVESSPIVAGGLVVLGDWAGNLKVLDAASGTERWATTMAKIVGTPAVSSNKLFVVDTAGTLQSFQLDTGVKLGAVAVGVTLASPTIHEGKIFIGNEAGEMKAYDTETLTLLWKFSVNSLSTLATGNSSQPCPTANIPVGQIRGAPAVYEGKVIFGSMNHWVFAINEQGEPGQTTLPQWIFQTNDLIVSSPMIDHAHRRVIIGSYDEHVYSLPSSPANEGPIRGKDNAICGAPKNSPGWTYEVPAAIGQSKVHSTPATDGNRIYFGANNGHVYAIYSSNGTGAWDFATGDAAIASPAVANGIVVAGSDDGNVYWLYADNGTKARHFSTGSALKASPAIDGARAFTVSFDGSVYMFGPKIPARPDLSISSITYANEVITVVIHNGGNGLANASVLRLTIDGALASDIKVPAIPAGSDGIALHSVKLASGVHMVQADSDQTGVLAESSESNNAYTATLAGKAAAKKDDKFLGIPGLPLPLLLAALALAVAARRQR